MIRSALVLTFLSVSMLSMGCCCGPMQCSSGIGLAADGCDSCCGTDNDTMPYSPLDGLRRARRSLTCGSGCGETYVGEWISTPPDACDPCCDDQWVGGAIPWRPICWQPGALLSSLYGVRYCDGDASSAECGCDDGCDSGSTEGFIENEIIEGGVSKIRTNSGCSTCDARNARRSIQNARHIPSTDRVTRSARTTTSRSHQVRR